VGNIRNEFQQPMVLVSATLTQGTWTTKPPQSIDIGSAYAPVFTATGTDGVEGTVVYGAQGAPNVVASFYFVDSAGNETSVAKVTPAPWIGGVATPTGTASALNFFFWTHEMCENSIACY